MARSSRRKHRDSGREHSDSERDSGAAKEKRSTKDSVSSEKRKLESKEYGVEEYNGSGSSSKRRKEEDGGSRKSGSSKSESRRREERSEGKYRERESSRKDRGGGENDGEGKDKKGAGGSYDNERNILDDLQNSEADNHPGKRSKKRRDGYDNTDKHQDDGFENNDRRLSSRESRQKDEKHKDERYREKYRDDVGGSIRHGDDLQRDENISRDYADKDASETRQRDRGRGRERDRDHENDSEREHYRDFDYYHERDRSRARDRARNRSRSRDNDHDYGWDWEHDQDKYHDHDRKADRDRDIDHGRIHEYDRDDEGSHLDDRGTRYKDRRGRKRSPDDRDDFDESTLAKSHYSDKEKRLMSGGRVEADAERGRSQSRQAHMENRRRSPTAGSHAGVDEQRHLNSEEMRYRESVLEQRKKSRDAAGYYGGSERGSKYRYLEKASKIDDGHSGELASERTSSKASPMGFLERSPSAGVERRFMHRPGARRSLDGEESGRKGSALDGRDLSATEDRFYRDVTSGNPVVDESSQADSTYYGRTGQGSSSQPSAFRAGVDSPSRGSVEEDGRASNSARYRRSSDPNVGRGPGNAWRGVPNWPSPAPNGFLPFQHGPPHGGFQAMIPQFAAPPMFGVRPSMDISHSGFPYHIPDAERFSAHVRPLGWQNMMDGSGPPHLHGWEGNNGIFRDESHMYGGPEWEQNRQGMNSRGWESGGDVWKGQTDEVSRDLPSNSQKDVPALGLQVDSAAGQASQRSEREKSQEGVEAEAIVTRSGASPVKETVESPPESTVEKESNLSKISSHDYIGNYSRTYVSKIDISEELVNPELYEECLKLVDMFQSTTVDKELHGVLENDYWILTGEETPSDFPSPLISTPINDSAFQGALDLYKKHVEVGGILLKKVRALDTFSVPTKGAVEEQVLVNEENAKEPSCNEDMLICHDPASDQNNTATVSDDKVQYIQTSGQGLPISVGSGETQPIPNREEIQDISHEQGKPSREEIQEISLEHGKPSILPPGGEDIEGMCKIKCNASACSPEDRQNVGEAMSGQFYSDGTPKGCEALMPESNESESVILHRIHHSPESTH